MLGFGGRTVGSGDSDDEYGDDPDADVAGIVNPSRLAQAMNIARKHSSEQGSGSAGQGSNGRPELSRDGCRVQGGLRLKKAAGNFHVVPRPFSARGSTGFFRGMPVDELLLYNASHVVHDLAFGPAFRGQESPLRGVVRAHEEGPAQFQYYVTVVPTLVSGARASLAAWVGSWIGLGGSEALALRSAQYSATEFTAATDPTSVMMTPPGVIFRFDFSPVMVMRKERSRTIAQLLTSVCAILGGVFAVSGMLDGAIHRAGRLFKKAD